LHRCSAHKCIFDHRPERLVLTGYRCAMAGYDYGDPACWDSLWRHYVNEGGLDFTCAIMGTLQYWVRSLRSSATRPNSYFPQGCLRIARNECLVLTILSGQQHNDTPSTAYALQHLLGEDPTDAAALVVETSTAFARSLSNSGHTLMPVPIDVIQSVIEPGNRPLETH
jgi:hypothetical protein